VTLGHNLKNIYTYAFFKTKITNTFTIPNSVELIEAYAFSSCNIKELIFESGGTAPLTMDGNNTFASNTNLTSVVLPARLTSAYKTETWNNATVKTFVHHFTSCASLTSIEVETGSTLFQSIDGVLYELDEQGNPTILLYCPPHKKGDFVVPKEVRKVEGGAFRSTQLTRILFEEYDKDDPNYGKPLLELGGGSLEERTLSMMEAPAYSAISMSTDMRSDYSGKLTLIQFPSHLRSIGALALYVVTDVEFNMDAHLSYIEGAAFFSGKFTEIDLPAVDRFGISVFSGCTALTKVTFHENSNLNAISDYMFDGCASLTSVNILPSVQGIGNYAFYNCRSLATLSFPENSRLTAIGQYAFHSCALEHVVLPENVSMLYSYAFQNCTNLKTLTLSKSLGSFNNQLVSGCTSLEAVYVADGNNKIKSIDGVVYDAAETILYCYPQAKDPTGFTLPDTLLTLHQYSLANFPGTELVLPEGLETIAAYAIYRTKVISIHIPASVRTLANNSMRENTSLVTLTFATNGKLTELGSSCFYQCTSLKKVDLPDNITTMGTSVFSGCTALEEVTLPAALKELPGSAFSSCQNLKSLVLQEGLELIAGNAVMGTTASPLMGLTELNIPSTVKEIGNNAFSYNEGLRTVTFGEGSRLETLGSFCFQGCTSLEGITLPASLKTIVTSSSSYSYNGTSFSMPVSGAFQGCVSMKYIDMSACKNIEEIPSKMFTDCISVESILLPSGLESIADFAFGDPLNLTKRSNSDKATQTMISLKEITFPESLRYIGAYNFYGCASLETITFPTNSPITALGSDDAPTEHPYWGQSMFANTTSLKSIQLPSALNTVGPNCFENSGIGSIDLPAGVDTICDGAFKNCDNLTQFDLPSQLIYLGDEAFCDCNNLEKADLGYNVEYLGSMAFGFCEKLQSAYIPANVTNIPGNPFTGCVGITSFQLDSGNTEYKVVDGALFDKSMYTLLYYPASLTAEVFTFPTTVQEIAPGAFSGAKLTSIVLPSLIKRIPDYAFMDSAIASIQLHNGVNYIGDHAFDGCWNLNNVTIPSSVKYAGHYAFANCTSLNNFVFEDMPDGTDPYVIGTHFFDGCTAMTQLFLPNKMVMTDEEYQIYKTSTSNNIYNPTGVIPSYMFANTGIVHAVVPEHITDIHSVGVFYGCQKLESVVFEASLLQCRSIGTYYFAGCTSLKNIELWIQLTQNGNTNTTSTSVFYDSYQGEESGVFMDCTSLETVTIHLKVSGTTGVYTYNNTFRNCTSLKKITILNNSNKEIGFRELRDGTLAGCTSLEALPIFSSGTKFYGSPFAGCDFEVLHFQNISSFEGAIFAGMKNLKSVFIKKYSTLKLYAETFTNLENDVNIYFYNMTYEEVVKAAGNDFWYTNADAKAHFYFKDTMPDDVVIPE